jgi:hypothetical protein
MKKPPPEERLKQRGFTGNDLEDVKPSEAYKLLKTSGKFLSLLQKGNQIKPDIPHPTNEAREAK